MTPEDPPGLVFGIYPGGAAGDDAGDMAAGSADEPTRVSRALDELQGRPGRPFLVGAYAAFDDTTKLGEAHATDAPADALQYAVRGRRIWSRSTGRAPRTWTATANTSANWSSSTARSPARCR